MTTDLPSQKKLPLIECFGPTIQGEGALIGQQTYFLRFGGCDYKCAMCDSLHAVDPQLIHLNARWLTQWQIAQELQQQRAKTPHSTEWVTFSGGNPCIHDLNELARQLRSEGLRIAVETQGTFAPEWLHRVDVITISPKGPGMGERLELDKLDQFLGRFGKHRGVNIKVVIFDQRDLEVAAMLVERYHHHTQRLLELNQFYLSLGNPFPPGHDLVIQGTDLPRDSLTNALRHRYLSLFEDIKVHPVLSQIKFLPQWHVWLYGNQKGV